MSTAVIFGVGSVLFIAITWAAIAFGVQRMHELRQAEIEDSDQAVVTRSDGLTELHVVEGDRPGSASFSSTGSANRRPGTGSVIRYRPSSE